MDVIELLTKDHAEVDALFERYDRTDDPEERRLITRQIIHDLSVHAALEEIFVYPLVRTKVSGAAADEAIGEHADVKRLLADLEGLDLDADAHADTVHRVATLVRAHVAEEEGEVFARLRTNASEETRATIGMVAEKAKHLVPTHPHPMVPGLATTQLLAGPWAATVDKVRDLLGR